MTESEPPFDRRGETVDREREPRTVSLHGGRRESVFQLAHRHLGEWRQWIDIVEENDLVDPLDPRGRTVGEEPSFISEEDDDVTDDTDVGAIVVAASPEITGDGVIHVEDIDEETFALSFQAPPDDEPGEPVEVTEAEFFDTDDSDIARRFTLQSYRERYFVLLEIDLDALLCIWMMRQATVRFISEVERTEIQIPKPGLGPGRGERVGRGES